MDDIDEKTLQAIAESSDLRKRKNGRVIVSLKKKNRTASASFTEKKVLTKNEVDLLCKSAEGYLAAQIEAGEFSPYLLENEYVIWKNKPHLNSKIIVAALKIAALFSLGTAFISFFPYINLYMDNKILPTVKIILYFIPIFVGISGALAFTYNSLSQRYAVTNKRILLLSTGRIRSEFLENAFDAQKDFCGGDCFDISFKTHKLRTEKNIGPDCVFKNVDNADAARIINTLSEYCRLKP